MGVATEVVPPGFLKDGVGHPGEGPYLAAVGVAAELEVHAGILGLLKAVGLVVQEDGEAAKGIGQLPDGLPVGIAPVVPADDGDAAKPGHGVPQEGDSGAGEERLGLLRVADVLVVAQDGVDGRLDARELCGVVPLDDGPELDVHYVSAEEHQVRILRVDEVHPAGELGPAVAVAKVEVRGQNHRQRPLQGLFRPYRQFFPVLVPVVDSAGKEDDGNGAHNAREGVSVRRQPLFWDEAQEHAQIGHDECDQEVQIGDHPGVADFIQGRYRPDGCVFAEHHAAEGRRHPYEEKPRHRGLYRP